MDLQGTRHMAKYEPLAPTSLPSENAYLCSLDLPEIIHIDDPALDTMLDFKQSRALTISPEVPIDLALKEMELAKVHMLFVAEADCQVLGLISSMKILGRKPIQIMDERSLERREISTRMIMTPITEVPAVPYSSLSSAKIGHIIASLNEFSARYLLVVEEQSGQQIIRGMFAASHLLHFVHINESGNDNTKHLVEKLQSSVSKG
jgi:CBS domain containing-hemolysin-like protein